MGNRRIRLDIPEIRFATSHNLSPWETRTVERFRHVMVGLTGTGRDAALIQYAALLARLDTAVELRFVHVLPKHAENAEAHEHDLALEAIEQQVGVSLLNVPNTVRVYCDVLKGPSCWPAVVTQTSTGDCADHCSLRSPQ